MDSMEELSIELYYFISEYIPKGWKEPVGKVDFVPRFTNEEMQNIFNSWMMNEFDDDFQDMKWYIKDAIKEFLEPPIIGFRRFPMEVKLDIKI